MSTERTGLADAVPYAEYDQASYAGMYLDPSVYGKDTAYGYSIQNDMLIQQEMMFKQHRVDQARFANPDAFQMGVAVMEDTGQTNIDYEIEWFLYDDGVDPLQPRIDEAKKKAQDFMQHVKTKFPNRYFILKRVTDQNDIWQVCALDKNYIVIQDDSYAKKLQNCYEVIIDLLFLSLNGEFTK